MCYFQREQRGSTLWEKTIFQRTFNTWIKGYFISSGKICLIFVPLSPANLPLCISTKSYFDFHLGMFMHWSSFLCSVTQTAVKSSCFESYIKSFFKNDIQRKSLFSNTVFYFSKNFLQAKMKVCIFFPINSFPVVI